MPTASREAGRSRNPARRGEAAIENSLIQSIIRDLHSQTLFITGFQTGSDQLRGQSRLRQFFTRPDRNGLVTT